MNIHHEYKSKLYLMVEIFMGQNFLLVFYLIGCNFRHLPNILPL